MLRRALAAIALFGLIAAGLPLKAGAQTDSGQITITVTDATSKAPIVLARVLLDGPVLSSEYSGTNGSVRFTEVPDGIYRARVFSRGYQAVTSDQFEIVNGRSVNVSVSLAKQEELTIIGSVTVRSSATISTSTLSDTSPQRKLSDTLADALNKISGVSVSTSSSDSDATQTVSLEGHDASQTALTLDGIPLNAPGTAGDLRQISTDLFSSASASFGPQIGGLGGGVGFRTIEPTLSWQSKFGLSAGSNGKNNYSFAETGSLGKLGIAIQHTYRSTPSLIDGQVFADTSGLNYSHDGESASDGNLVKLRYGIGQSQVLTGTYLSSDRNTDVVCLQFTGPLPCGYGPGNTNDGKFQLYSLVDTALIGDTSVQAAIFGSRSSSTHDLLDRFVAGEAQPTGSSSLDKNTGFTLNATLPARDRHTISISAYSTSSSNANTPLIASARPYSSASSSSSYSSLSLNDAIRSSAQLKLNTSIGISHASNAAGSLLAGVNAIWSPTGTDSYSASYNIGGVAAHGGRVGLLSDPASLRFDCNGNVAYGSAPGDQPGVSSSTSARLSYTHTFKAGLISTSLYRQVQNGTVLPTQVNGTALLPYGIFPPGYFGLVQTAFDSAGGCNVPGGVFGPQNVYFSTPIGNVRRVYEGVQASGYFTLGNLVAQPFYNISVSKAISSDPRINNPYSIALSGNQLPNVPLHRAGLTLDYKAPRSALEYLMSAQYTSVNNPQNLPAFTTVDAGVSAALQRGTLTFAANNIFNTFGGTFASNTDAVPYTTQAGAQILTIARPLAPRQYSVTYSINFGPGARTQNTGSGSIQPQNIRYRGEAGGPSRSGQGARRLALTPLPETPPNAPLDVIQNAACSKDGAIAAAALLDPIKAYVAKIETAKTAAGYPNTVDGAPATTLYSVVYHNLPPSYALSIEVKQFKDMRAVLPCIGLHIAQPDQVASRNLYQPQSSIFFRPQFSFMPAVGLYIVPPKPQAGQESFRLYKLPTAPPTDPFQEKSGPQCTVELKTSATKLLAELKAHFAANAPTVDFTITSHSAKSGAWYDINATDIGSIPALLYCSRVSAGSKAELQALGYDGVRPPVVNYAPALGLYILRGTGPQPSPAPSSKP